MRKLKNKINAINEIVEQIKKKLDDLFEKIQYKYSRDDKKRIMRYTLCLKDDYQNLKLEKFDIINNGSSSRLIEIHSFILFYPDNDKQNSDVKELIDLFIKTSERFSIRYKEETNQDWVLKEEFCKGFE